MSDPYYQGRRAWVVGGSQGIGLALAEQLSQRGAQVTLCARNQATLESQALRLKAQHLPLDVADAQSTLAALQSLIQQQGPPDLVFNCAGLALPGYLLDLSVEDIVTMNQVNYLGTVHVCKAVLPAMIAHGRGHIVNTSSLGGLMGLFGYTGYCGSKYAVVGFSEALRREVAGQKVRVSVLCPPNTKTPGLDQENQRKPREVLAQEEQVKVLEPTQVASYTLKVLPKNPSLIIPSLDGRWAHRLGRFAPSILGLFLKRPPAP